MRIDAAEPETDAPFVGADDIARWEHSAIALAISWAGLIAATLLLFRMGVEIGLMHGVGWIAGYFAVLGWLERNERREVVVRSAASVSRSVSRLSVSCAHSGDSDAIKSAIRSAAQSISKRITSGV